MGATGAAGAVGAAGAEGAAEGTARHVACTRECTA